MEVTKSLDNLYVFENMLSRHIWKQVTFSSIFPLFKATN